MKNWLSKYWKWIAIVIVLIAASAAAKHFLPLDEWMKALSAWVEKLGPFGIVVFALIYAVATVLFIPGSILTISAGLIFGVGLGTLAAWSGAVLGSSLAFLIGRYFARAKIEAKTKGNEKFEAIDEAIGKQGWKMIGLLRLSPLIPFSISNYFYGITKVGFWPYVAASAVGMLPGTLVYVYLGATQEPGALPDIPIHFPDRSRSAARSSEGTTHRSCPFTAHHHPNQSRTAAAIAACRKASSSWWKNITSPRIASPSA